MLNKYLLHERFCGPWSRSANKDTPYIWLHGASLGECKVLVNVAKRLIQDFPNARFLITTQKAEILGTLNKLVDCSNNKIEISIAPAPLNIAVKKFCKQVKPSAIVLCENELWPAYLNAARQNNLNVALVSGRFHSAAPWAKLSQVKFATFQTEGDKKRFEKCANSQNIEGEFYGNWKLLLSEANRTPNQNQQFDIAFLSVHFSEWDGIKNLVKSNAKNGKQVFIAPRRLEEVASFDNATAGLKGVTILNKFGVLNEYIPKCKAAVMGGSFTKRPGIHNFLEPLLFGVPTFVGPFAHGEVDFVNQLLSKKILTRIPYGTDFLPEPSANSEQITKFLNEETIKVERGYKALVEKLQQWIKL